MRWSSAVKVTPVLCTPVRHVVKQSKLRGGGAPQSLHLPFGCTRLSRSTGSPRPSVPTTHSGLAGRGEHLGRPGDACRACRECGISCSRRRSSCPPYLRLCTCRPRVACLCRLPSGRLWLRLPAWWHWPLVTPTREPSGRWGVAVSSPAGCLVDPCLGFSIIPTAPQKTLL